jgi:hypothetical protein
MTTETAPLSAVRVEPVVGWQPIETAPKDGSIVQLRDERRVYNCAMAWNKTRNQWEGMSFGVMGAAKTSWDESFVKIHEWRHLPL